MPKNSHRVAVYGTLKGMNRGGRWTGNIEYLGNAYSLFESFEMWGGSYPVVIRSEDGPNKGFVSVEIYQVDDDTLEQLDRYEGAPSLYEAEPVLFKMTKTNQEITALMYLGKSIKTSLKHRPIIKPSSSVLYWPYPAEYRPDAL